MPPASALFDAEFLRALEGLRLVAKRVPKNGRSGEQRSRARGAGIEFDDVRPYVAGDDLRAVDWRLWQRLDRLFLRVYLQDQDLPLYFLLDQSRSMSLRGKRTHALRAVAALAYIALHGLDRVTVLPFAGEPLAPLPGMSGKRAFHRLLSWLEALPAGGGTALVEHLERSRARRLRRGLCVLVSDLYDPRGLDAVAKALLRIEHRLLVVRPVHQDEARPDPKLRPELAGEVELVECESGRTLALELDAAALDRHERAYRAFEAGIADLAKRRATSVLTLRLEEPVTDQLAALFTRGELVV